MRQATVFVVDDEEQICALLTRILQREGLRTFPFRSGAEALAAAEKEPPDLVVTDLMMPGIDGLQLAQRVKAIRPEAAVIVITGYASLENVVDAMRSGVDDFVTKPFGVAEIRAVVQRVLASRTQSPAAAPTATTAEAPRAPAESHADPAAALARRLRDIALLESIHGLLAEDLGSREVAARAAGALGAALGVTRALILVPGDAEATFRVLTPDADPASARAEHEAPMLALVQASGVAAAIERGAVGSIADRLDAGPAAAAALRPREPTGDDAGLLLVSRAADARRFEGEDLRVLGVAASALGGVFHAVRAAERAEEAYVASLLDVVAATEHRTPWFRSHSLRVRELSLRLARRIGVAPSDLEILECASQLLDLGRVHLHDEVLAKPGRLSSDEWHLLRSHPEIADTLVRPLGRLRHAKPVIRHHHENWDGTGYPDGLRGDEIPALAALVRITDTYAALTSSRPWRPAFDAAEAVRRIVDYSGTHFHPQMVAAFAEMQLEGGEPEAA